MTILLVEDDSAIQHVLIEALKTFDKICHGVFTIAEAKTYLGNNNPKLIILDIVLPDGIGTELLDFIKTKHPHSPPVIVTSALHNVEKLLKSYKIHSLLKKPFSLDDLEKAVNFV